MDTFQPSQVHIGNPISYAPYIGSIQDKPQQYQPLQSGNVVQSQAVRATGSGPYDAAFRQNLATYAGGNFFRPGGMLGFNPTGNLFGNPTGYGNAPVLGMPTDLLTMALGGQPFSTNQNTGQ